MRRPASAMPAMMARLTAEFETAAATAYAQQLAESAPLRFNPDNIKYGIAPNAPSTINAKRAKGRAPTPLVDTGRLALAVRTAVWRVSVSAGRALLTARIPNYGQYVRQPAANRVGRDWLRLTPAEVRRMLVRTRALAARARRRRVLAVARR